MEDLVFDEATIKRLIESEGFIDTYLKSIENEGEALRDFALAHVAEALSRKGQAIKDSMKQREFAVPSDWTVSLRDWFAGMALSGLIARVTESHVDLLAETAYQIADEMMKVREKK